MSQKLNSVASSPCTSNTSINIIHHQWSGSNDESKIIIDPTKNFEYAIFDYLGKGGFAKCYAAVSFTFGKKVALKVITKNSLKEKSQLDKIRKEVGIHELIDHQNIIKLLNFFEDFHNFYMVLELCLNSTLLFKIHTSFDECLDDVQSRFYLGQIVDAVLYLHEEKCILHRDLKPGNILLTDKNQVKLADFGLAIKIEEVQSSLSICGTPNYLSPQVLKQQGHSKESEAWSLGCILYCMIVGKPPFESNSLTETYKRIIACKYSYPPNFEISKHAEYLILRLLDPNTLTRMKVNAIKHQMFFKEPANRKSLFFSKLKSLAPMEPVASACSGDASSSALLPVHGHSGDSGFGSNACLVFQNRCYADSRMLYRMIMSGSYVVADRPPTVPDVHLSMVSKWVDYTNKYGFGCVMSNGTNCVLFVDNSVLSYRCEIDIEIGRYLFVSDALLIPWAIGEWSDFAPTSNPDIEKKIRIAKRFSQYMNSELRSVFENGVKNETMDLVISQEQHRGVLLMLLAMGNVQVNFLDSHEKLIFNCEENGKIVVSLFSPGKINEKYDLLPCGPNPSRPDCRKVQHLLDKAKVLLAQETFPRNTQLITSC